MLELPWLGVKTKFQWGRSMSKFGGSNNQGGGLVNKNLLKVHKFGDGKTGEFSKDKLDLIKKKKYGIQKKLREEYSSSILSGKDGIIDHKTKKSIFKSVIQDVGAEAGFSKKQDKAEEELLREKLERAKKFKEKLSQRNDGGASLPASELEKINITSKNITEQKK